MFAGKTIDMDVFEDTESAFKYKSDKDLKWSYRMFFLMQYPVLVKLGKWLLNASVFLRLPIKPIIKHTVFRLFCGGESMNECRTTIGKLAEYNIKSILDYSVEAKDHEDDFDYSKNQILSTLNEAEANKNISYSVFKVSGIARLDLLETVSSGKSLNNDEEHEFQRVRGRINEMCQKAFEIDVPILIDAEESWIQNAIDRLAEEMMMKYNKEKAIVYNTIQLYRADRLEFLKTSAKHASQSGYVLGVKLVRGAYLEKERNRAKKMGYVSPIHVSKELTDQSFDDALEFCIKNIDGISLCCGSHNERSNALLLSLMKDHGLQSNDERIFFAQLLGMSDHISFNLSKSNYNVAKYVPFGPVYDVTPYLIRRTEENTSIAGQTNRELELIKRENLRRKNNHVFSPESQV